VIAKQVRVVAGLSVLIVLVVVSVVGCFLLNSSPVASFIFTLSQGTTPCVVAVDASASTDPDGIIVKYEWAFGDGAAGADRLASHVYSTDGTYTITLVVTDDDGESASVGETVTVLPPYEPPPDLPSLPPIAPTSTAGLVRFEGCDSPQSLLSLPAGAGSTFFMENVYSVVLLDAMHQRVAELIDNNTDADVRRDFNGSGSPAFLYVVAFGCWAITVVGGSPAQAPPQTYTGCGPELNPALGGPLLIQYSPLFTLDPGKVTFYYGPSDSGGRYTRRVLLDYWRNIETPLSHEVEVLGGTYLLKMRNVNLIPETNEIGCWEVSVEQ
jgi:PKD repeat protein